MRPRARSAFAATFIVTGIAAGIAVAGGGAASDSSRTPHSAPPTRVTVTVTDSKFTLSRSKAHTGSVIFTVTNQGKVSHDFEIAGKKTPLLLPRHSATLRVKLSKKGRYPYRSTVPGQASAGLKGIFMVAAPTAPVTTTTPTTTPSAPPIGSANTTVTVAMLDYPNRGSYEISPSQVPSGDGHVRDHQQVRRAMQLPPGRHQGGRDPRLGSVGDVDGRAGPRALSHPLRR